MTKKFVPEDFQVPEKLETEKFRLRMLSVDDVEKDYDAVMSSREHLNPNNEKSWPRESMTMEDNLNDLTRHQEEFLKRDAFAYTVMNLDESQCLGCVYLYPSDIEEFDSEIFMWVRSSELANGLDELLFKTVSKWTDEVWPFENVVYPGRSMSMEDWNNMAKKLVPEDFQVPEKLETEKFRLRMLSVDDVEKDYESIMSSREYLNTKFRSWARENMTLEDHLRSVKSDQENFLLRTDFVYTVMSLDESKCLGGVFINPCQKEGFDAQISTWVRSSELANGLDKLLLKTVRKWMEEVWPFSNVAY